MRTKSSLPILSSLATAALLAPLHLRAQEASPAAPGEVHQMDRFEVKGVPVELSTNPLTREVGSVLGDDRNLLETPRGVSTLTTALFNERQIHGVRDVLVYSPSAYAGSSYGKTTVPNLRGDTAETYLNGQRLSYNLYGYFPSFNGVEAVDLVRGPGSAVYGAGYFTGGYVNYVSKRPSFGAASTTVTARIGTWAPGQTSFLNTSVQLDTTAALSDKLAWRFSYEGLEDETFWRKHGGRDDRQDFYAALTWRASQTTTVDLNAQFMWQSAPETLGVNRVTQDLIDQGLYYTGTSADRYPTPGGIPATSAVKLPWDATLFSDGDYSNANIWRVQGVVTTMLSDSFKLVNRDLYEHVDRRRYNAFEYIEYVTQDTAEHRTELHADWSLFGQTQKTITGGTIRYEGRESYTSYYNEYFYNFDITQGNVFSEATQFQNSYWPGAVGPGGHLFFSSVYDSPETVRSETWNPALFLQQDLALTRQLSAVIGYRFDDFWARARDPLPPAGGPYFRDAEEVSTHSQAYSLIYRPLQNLSLYATHNRIHAANGNVTGGGVILNVPDGQINRSDFRNLSELWELGVKAALLDNKLYLAGDWFEQARSRVSLKGKKSNIIIRGVELEATYQPIPRLSFTANATFQDGHYVQSKPFQMGGRSIYDAYALGRGPGGQGTDTGSFDPWGNQVPVGDWPLLGFSNTLLNGSVRYQLPCGIGAGLNAQWQSPQKGNLDNQWHIPSQVLLNANLFYERGRWLYNLDFLNLSNERNWIHNGDAYTGSQLISPELPFRLEGYVKYRF